MEHPQADAMVCQRLRNRRYGASRLGRIKVHRNTDRDWTIFGSGFQKVQAFTDQLNNFCNAILGTEQLLISYEDAIVSVEVVDHAYESFRNDHWVTIAAGDQTVNASLQ